MGMSKQGCLSRRELSALTLKASAAALLPLGLLSSTASGQEVLTEGQIRARLREIQNKYSLGESLSLEDGEFVKKHAWSVEEAITRMADLEAYFDNTGSSFGTTVRMQGRAYHEGTINYRYGADATLTTLSGPTPQSMSFTVHCTAWYFGQDTPFVSYNDGVSATCYNQSVFPCSPSRSYSAVALRVSVEVYASIVTQRGSFSIYAQ